jgi:hypothetical protein
VNGVPKFTDEAIFYHYDLDTESLSGSGPSYYTSAIRLKEIKDAKEFSIKFQYQRKDDHEFQSSFPSICERATS